MNYLFCIHLYNSKANSSLLGALLRSESSKEVGDDLLQCSIGFGRDLAILSDGAKQTLVASLDVLGELLLESCDLGGVKFVEMSTDTAVNDGNL